MKHQDYLRLIGRALRASREGRSWTQEAFAKKLKMHRTYYSAIERGEKNLTLETILRVCKGMNESPASIMQMAEDIEKIQ